MEAAPKPVPAPDAWTLPFWEAARAGRLVVQRCRSCGAWQHPPDVCCHRCRSDDVGFDQVSGRGTLHAFATFPRSLMPSFEAPYTVALVDLDDADVRMLANLLGARHADAAIGMPVEVAFERRGEWMVPQFRPVAAQPGGAPG